MKQIVVVILCLLGLVCKAQIRDGVYISTSDSYKSDFILVVESDFVTLYGYGFNVEGELVYYKSKAKLEKEKFLKFEEFEFQKNEITIENYTAFKKSRDDKLDDFVTYSSSIISDCSENEISFLGTKHVYDSRIDSFCFKRVKKNQFDLSVN